MENMNCCFCCRHYCATEIRNNETDLQTLTFLNIWKFSIGMTKNFLITLLCKDYIEKKNVQRNFHAAKNLDLMFTPRSYVI